MCHVSFYFTLCRVHKWNFNVFTESMFDFYPDTHRVKLVFWLPRTSGHSFSELSFSRSGSPTRNLVVSKTYPFQWSCFIGHLQEITFTWELSLRIPFTLYSASSKLVGAQFQACSPKRLCFIWALPSGGCPFIVLNSVKYLMFFNCILPSSSMCCGCQKRVYISSVCHVTKTFYL